jgi:hypothetical protein
MRRTDLADVLRAVGLAVAEAIAILILLGILLACLL